jgi:hypothetical protein
MMIRTTLSALSLLVALAAPALAARGDWEVSGSGRGTRIVAADLDGPASRISFLCVGSSLVMGVKLDDAGAEDNVAATVAGVPVTLHRDGAGSTLFVARVTDRAMLERLDTRRGQPLGVAGRHADLPAVNDDFHAALPCYSQANRPSTMRVAPAIAAPVRGGGVVFSGYVSPEMARQRAR